MPQNQAKRSDRKLELLKQIRGNAPKQQRPVRRTQLKNNRRIDRLKISGARTHSKLRKRTGTSAVTYSQRAKARLRRFRQGSRLAIALTALLLLAWGVPESSGQGKSVAKTPSQIDAAVSVTEATSTLRELIGSFLSVLPKIGIAIAIVILSVLLARILKFTLSRTLGSWSRATAIGAMSQVIIILLALGVALSVIAGDARALVGSVGLAGLALSWALQAALESRDEFISIASHELKTPLTSLKMYLDLTQRTVKPEQNLGPPPEKLAKVLNLSSKQVARLTTLVDDLLDVSRIQMGRLTYNLENVNLSDHLRDVLDRFSEEFIQAGCSLDFKAEPNRIGKWDPSRIEQVAINLISNALKYARGSIIRVELTRHNNDYVELVVKDSGPGIPKDRIDKIFERYERATSSISISGLGLGLFISKRIVEGHHGRI